MIQVVFGTSNKGKIADVRKLADGFGLEILSLADVGVDPQDIPETGETLKENAIIKYKALRPQVPEQYILVTEDFGLEIEALNGEPGVRTRRWNKEGRDMTDEELVNKTLRLLKDNPNRSALSACVIAYGGSNLPMQTLRGELKGEILEKPDEDGREPGLPFRALFYVPQAKIMLYKMHDIPLKARPNIPTHREQVWSRLADILEANG